MWSCCFSHWCWYGYPIWKRKSRNQEASTAASEGGSAWDDPESNDGHSGGGVHGNGDASG